MKTFVTADTHFGHGRILDYSQRLFKDTTHMNETLIKNWNMRVKKKDLVFFLGDFCFKSNNTNHLSSVCAESNSGWNYWKNRLQGNIIWIKGNHDNSGGVKTYIESINISFANKRLHLTHKPEFPDPTADITLCGHVHNRWRIRTFKEHYDLIEKFQSQAVSSDRQDWAVFLKNNEKQRGSDSILLNIGVDVQKFQRTHLMNALDSVSNSGKELVMGQYLNEYIEDYAPSLLRSEYYRLKELIFEIKDLEARYQFIKNTHGDMTQITTLLNNTKKEYTDLHAYIVKTKKKMKVRCNWESKRKGI